MPTSLGPHATTGVETRGVVRRDRSTARQFTDKSISHWRWDGRVIARSALDHGCRCSERHECHGSYPQ